jgi:pSer/pThr/pTyr-binding forkhead associated (FHA) protein
MPEPYPSSSARLIALAAGVLPDIYTLSEGYCVLGRSPGCHVVIRHALTSRQHARIERRGLSYIVRDSGSTNGTFVNAERVAQPRVLEDCDLIGLGSPDAMLQFRIK